MIEPSYNFACNEDSAKYCVFHFCIGFQNAVTITATDMGQINIYTHAGAFENNAFCDCQTQPHHCTLARDRLCLVSD